MTALAGFVTTYFQLVLMYVAILVGLLAVATMVFYGIILFIIYLDRKQQ